MHDTGVLTRFDYLEFNALDITVFVLGQNIIFQLFFINTQNPVFSDRLSPKTRSFISKYPRSSFIPSSDLRDTDIENGGSVYRAADSLKGLFNQAFPEFHFPVRGSVGSPAG